MDTFLESYHKHLSVYLDNISNEINKMLGKLYCYYNSFFPSMVGF